MKRRFTKYLALLMVFIMLITLISPTEVFTKKADAAELPTPLAFYDFKDGLPSTMTALANGTTAAPTVTFDSQRGPVLDLSFAENGKESYVTLPNPYSLVTDLTGATMMLWVKVDPSASFMAYDNLIGFTGTTGRLTLQTMPYLCYNAGGSWVDLKSTQDPALSAGVWAHVAVTISDNNVSMYINGKPITYNYAGIDNDGTVADDTSDMLTFLKTASAYLGYGSFWGTQDCFMDSVSFYDTVLTADQIQAAYVADPCVVPADLTSGLAAHYSFDTELQDSVSGLSATEVSGTGSNFGQTVTGTSSLEYIVGQKGRAVHFSGSSGTGIKLPQTITGKDYTISFWMKPTDYVDWSSMIFATGATGQFMNIMGQGWSDDSSHPQITFHKDAINGEAAVDYVSGNTLDKALEEVWTNITYVVDQSDDDTSAALTLYVDGVKQQVFVYPSVQDAGNAIVNFFSGSAATMYLGVNWWDPAFNGSLDELYLYNRALSAVDVAALHSNGLEDTDAGTVATPKSRVSVHDPAIFKDGSTYYLFGSHMAWAKSTDLKNWTTFTNNINTDYETIFSDIWTKYCKTSTNPNVSGNLWAPDVIYNSTMQKYCMYMSVNGDDWNSSIVLLTADKAEGPYTYVGPVVYSGFNTTTHNANLTDVYTVLGDNADLSRYQSTSDTKINAIDANVKYDKNGDMWMTFGSWFGGIYMLKLDQSTGFRDYSTTYQTVADVSDQYYGYKIAGGHAVSGEGPYIIYNQQTGYYYLFESYGGLAATGGYNMRMYRSTNIYGPYVDAAGYSSVRTADGDNSSYGIKLMGNYTFNCLSKGYKSAGHNSAFIDTDGQMYLIYHTRFNDGTEAHQVRVHQMFINEDGWPVVAPYEYNGDGISGTGYTTDQVTGYYEFINHGLNTSSDMLVTQTIKLNADHTITGDVTGTWSTMDGKNYMNAVINGVTYKGVFFRQSDESAYNNQVMTFSAIGSNNQSIWGSRIEISDYDAVVKDAQTLKNSLSGKTASNITLPTSGYYDTNITWSSDKPDVLSNTGIVNRQVNDTTVTLKAVIIKGSEVNMIQIPIVVLGTNIGSLSINPIYRYDFGSVSGSGIAFNSGTKTGDATLMGSTSITTDSTRGNVLEIKNADGAKKVNYLALPADTFDGITTEGYTVGMWVDVDKSVTFEHSALFEANGGGQDQYPVTRMGVNLYSRINSNGKWADATTITNSLTSNTWHYVTYTVNSTGIAVYLDGVCVGTATENLTDCFTDNFLKYLDDVRVGSGNIWGDEDVSYAKFDNVVIYNKALTADEATTLYNIEFASSTIDNVTVTPATADVEKGAMQQFTAALQGFNTGASNVVWAVSGSAITSSTISSTGLLTVGTDEVNSSLTVSATSVVNPAKVGSATVNVVTGSAISLKVSDPVINTNPENTIMLANNSSVLVNLSTSVSGAAIYYTIDNTEPGINSTLYNGEFIINTNQTNGDVKVIKAIAMKDGLLNSNIVSKSIVFAAQETSTVTPTPVTPTPAPTTTPTPTPKPTPVIVNIPGSDGKVTAAISVDISKDKMNVVVEVSAKDLDTNSNSPMDITIPLSTVSLISQLKDKDVKNVDINVKVPNSILSGSNTNDIKINLDSQLLQTASQTGSDVNVSVNDETGKKLYSWSFNAEDLANSKQNISDVNLTLAVERAFGDDNLNKLLSNGNGNDTQNTKNGIVIRFGNDGVLPAQASVKIYVGNLVSDTNSTVYLYHYNQNTGKLETLPYSSRYEVNSEGYIKINLLYCSDYVILPQPANRSVITSLVDQIKVSASNEKLYIGETSNISVSLPSTLELVSSLEDKTSSSAVGAVTVSYKSKNSDIATVDSNGKITATGNGSTTILTLITLYSGKSIALPTMITVKPVIKLTSRTSTMKLGESFNFSVVAYGLDGEKVTWSTSKKSVLVIDQNGKATAVSKGTDYVKVTIGDITKTIKVVVK